MQKKCFFPFNIFLSFPTFVFLLSFTFKPLIRRTRFWKERFVAGWIQSKIKNPIITKINIFDRKTANTKFLDKFQQRFTPLSIQFSISHLKLRVVKAFRSSIDEFDEHNHSVSSAHSVHSMRGYRSQPLAGDVSTKRTSVCSLICRANSPQPYPFFHSRQKPNGQLHHKMSCDNAAAIIGNNNPTTLLRSPQYSPILSSSPASASSTSPQAVVVENGRQFFMGNEATDRGNTIGNNPLSSIFATGKRESAQERIPLVIKYNPNKGATTTRGNKTSVISTTSSTNTSTTQQIPLIARTSQMGKSYSIDAPVSIAHV